MSIRWCSQDPINELEEGETLAYVVSSRDDFNALRISAITKVEIDQSHSATIKRVVAV